MFLVAGKQKTIARQAQMKGRGLHSGQDIVINLYPAPPDGGFIFRRLDLSGHLEIKGNPENVVNTTRATTLGEGEVKISTVEHLLAASFAAGIDNLLVEVQGPEIPIMDGSAGPFYDIIQEAGRQEQPGDRRVWKIDAPLLLQEDNQTVLALPGEGLRITGVFFGRPPVGNQLLDRTDDWGDILKARTFGWMQDVEKLKSMGLIQGGSLDCAVVFDEDGPRNELRFPHEPVAHKILDLLGDLALFGPVHGHIIALGAGHYLHNLLARKLWELAGKEMF